MKFAVLLCAYLTLSAVVPVPRAQRVTHNVSRAALPATYVNYRYSVIPRGVHSQGDLVLWRQIDRVVERHYSDFGSSVQFAVLPADQYLYVSYRRAERVYWTAKKVRIRKGELLLTDGKSWARARCGNRLSAKPVTPNLPEEPNLDIPDVPQTGSTPPIGLTPFPPDEALLFPKPPDGSTPPDIPPHAFNVPINELFPPPLAPGKPPVATGNTPPVPNGPFFTPYLPLGILGSPLNSVNLPSAPPAIPEPITAAALLLGLVLLGFVRRRKSPR